jgi:hypothetical protein
MDKYLLGFGFDPIWKGSKLRGVRPPFHFNEIQRFLKISKSYLLSSSLPISARSGANVTRIEANSANNSETSLSLK